MLWPVLVPVAYAELLRRVHPKVLAEHTASGLPAATRFLWKDYNDDFLFWELVDTMRKLILTSIILFIDTETGSRKMLRLFLAILVSSLYLAALALARPFKMVTDLYIACVSNLLLTCCFVSGCIVKLCEEQDCFEMVGIFHSSAAATGFFAGVTILMITIALLTIVWQAATAILAPTIRLVATKREPEMILPPDCNFHAFISHGWGTGQACHFNSHNTVIAAEMGPVLLGRTRLTRSSACSNCLFRPCAFG